MPLTRGVGRYAAEPVTFCHGLKLLAADGKMRKTDCAPRKAAKDGASAAGVARKAFEAKLGRKVVSTEATRTSRQLKLPKG